ncbi:uncharacterized protein K452DRAFT_308579 [Aplosporella prunicola CBS 121167]|uniref:Condensin complex subunit 2 n=1 Tax=Aplosporella prunicola CBS 121167 TaxID=1176127 RepID=A0A6A6BFN7_9PEZI|nr:uncharacterized protein K452DRAFT_308579 [Aplosporella prunicola CBS 121167]KAF2142203.1 hypothetical protein K452DRAFT_308579 [Aplosporella prunicola CBS 121167]
MPRARDRYSMGTPHQGGIKVPLNDDRREKEKRLKSRRSLHENQMEQIRAAATPVKRRQSGLAARTPANEDDVYVGGDAVTPMKRVPILANFEEWMKMATDNKINAANSWNFALIDYFHDMSLLKEGDGVNFQRASCTLDGCVKIYTSRVDSVATETGKLLSGLADSRDKKNKGGDDAEADGEAGSDDEEGEDGTKKPKRKRAQRSAEATLVSSFQQLALKKMELEFSVDPLFKKASADFDEGGAKGLLLNHLSIDQNGRIVFDSSDDAQDASTEEKRRDSMEADDGEDEEDAEEPAQEAEIDIAGLGARFFPDLSRLDVQDICPSLKNFDMSDPNASKDLPFLKAPDDWRDQNRDTGAPGDNSGMFLDEDNAGGFDDDDDDMGAFDLPANTGFGEGGEAWAKEAALETQMRVHTINPDGDDGDNEDEVGGFDNNTSRFGVALASGREEDQENILNYFDQALSKNWAGPEHWRIRRIKDNKAAAAAGPTKRKEKEPFQIDFAAPMTQPMADALYTGASSSSTISMPKNQWKSKTRNLLPDDKHFNSRQLLRLFLKPKARMGSRRNGASGRSGAIGTGDDTRRDDRDAPDGEMDEVFWAQQRDAGGANDEGGAGGTYDADFFQDDALGAVGGDEDDDDIFADAREMFSPAPEGAPPNLGETLGGEAEGAFGAQLVTQSRRFRPEYVQYARVAKKVDVRRLKEEMWRGIGLGDIMGDSGADESSLLNNSTLPPSPSRRSSTMPPPPIPTDGGNSSGVGGAPPLPKAPDGSLMFTDVVNNLQSVYPKKTLADISTSYCFICLLHLANEKGLVIENQDGFTDLSIRKDPRGVGEGGE